MDLNEKAQWHVDFNGGMVPLLETRPDELIKESGIAAQFACELAGPDQGVELIPRDPIAAAKMRVLIEEHNKHLQPIYAVYGSRGEDPEKNQALA